MLHEVLTLAEDYPPRGRLDVAIRLLDNVDPETYTIISTIRLHGVLSQDYSNVSDLRGLITMSETMSKTAMESARDANWLTVHMKIKFVPVHGQVIIIEDVIFVNDNLDYETIKEYEGL